MKRLLLVFVLGILLNSCAQHACPTYSDSGLKYKHKGGGHPYGKGKH